MKRNIILTGASSGIGLAIANQLLEKNCSVVGISRTLNNVFLKSHPDFHFCPCDLSKLDQIEKTVAPLMENFPQINTLICNAGRGLFRALEEFSLAQIRSFFELNFLAHVYMCRILLPFFKKKDFSDILFIGSEAALKGKKYASLYSSCKFALRGFAQALRDECKNSHVRVSIIQPGMTNTPFFDSLSFQPRENTALSPESIAEAIWMVLNLERGAVCDEMILSPLKNIVEKKKPLS